MTDIFLINPKASLDDLGQAVSDRITQARAICMYVVGNSGGSDGDFIPNTFWAVESLLKDAERLHEEVGRRTPKPQQGAA